MKQRILFQTLLITCLLFCSFPLAAKIVLPALFSDNMVLQRRSEAPIWGTATPNAEVEIITSWDKKIHLVKAGSDGSWFVALRTTQAGGPHFITLSDGAEPVTLKNVMLGEVWLCSGQSNMEMPLAGWGKVLNYKEEIADADYPYIRLLKVKKVASPQPVQEVQTVGGGWQICTPATVENFSSVAYFFGKNLSENIRIPVGLIDASWGGTIAEAWTSANSLEQMPDFRDQLQAIREYFNDGSLNDYNIELNEWQQLIQSEDLGFKKNVPEWASAKYSDSDWDDIQLPTAWERVDLDGFDGIVWFRKTIYIPDNWDGQDLQLNLGVIDDNDITYFNGKEIGATNGYSVARVYTVPGKLVKKGKAVITVRVTDTGGDGGLNDTNPDKMYLALQSARKASIIPLAGGWKYQPTINLHDYPAPINPNSPNRVSVLYNGMIHPLVPYALQGVLWYQGESNVGRAAQYKELFPLLITDWRKAWEKDFPFYFVQLANFMERKTEPAESGWAALREAQLQTLQLKNTGMAVTIDIGDADDIHPKNKQEVGRRLSLIAREKVYPSKQKVAYSGPVYRDFKIDGNKIRIRFDYAESGLKIRNGEKLEGFAIAGDNRQFYWADAVISGKEIIVSAPDVGAPVAVRYAWADNPACNLSNGDNLPASPFRTDNWE